MNIAAEAASKGSNEPQQSARYAGSQLSLPLEPDARNEDALRAAWRRSGLSLPYQVALQNRPLAICLSCLAEAMRDKGGIDGYRAGGARRSKPGRR